MIFFYEEFSAKNPGSQFVTKSIGLNDFNLFRFDRKYNLGGKTVLQIYSTIHNIEINLPMYKALPCTTVFSLHTRFSFGFFSGIYNMVHNIITCSNVYTRVFTVHSLCS